ncbi:hypothetical protein BC939DRAFT_507053 [Gamsiella multidivaricata]|uniref:uncharacterized protein n=1 Tax=Gamsiella multidivaricata TaxID=101098 RepID=UPI00222056EB|nr:uncharacterized protein BC939DRAFT_507053 [Gamsiella multidivaricata]KAI7817884.1 hypothetical protein BC939DRAFT_507053 [Gamsiella multidivaricata]
MAAARVGQVKTKYDYRLLEVGSGSGQHISHFAKEYPHAVFQPIENNMPLFSSIEAYTIESNEQFDQTLRDRNAA